MTKPAASNAKFLKVAYKAASREEQQTDAVAFGKALAEALGGTLGRSEDGFSSYAEVHVGDLRLFIRSIYGKLGRVEIGASAPDLARAVSVYNTPKFPTATLDITRPFERVVADVKRRLVEASKEPLEILRGKASEQANTSANLKRHAAELEARFPGLSVHIEGAAATSGTIRSTASSPHCIRGKLYADGTVSLDIVSTLSADKGAAVLSALMG